MLSHLFIYPINNSTMQEIKLFGRALVTNNVDFEVINNIAVTKGYVVAKECCNDRVLAFLDTLPNNVNTTFYKSWTDVTDRNRFELLLDQLAHYASTYGTDHKGIAYVPNDVAAKLDFTDCKVIMPISTLEIQTKIQAMLESGIAMKQETIESCISLIKEFNLGISLENVKNKEALILLCDSLGLVPTSSTEMIRYLIYKATGETLVINSPEVLDSIKNASNLNITDLVLKFGLEELSSVFYRYKRIFLAFKKANKDNTWIVNRLRRRAKVNHKPMPQSFWNNILSDTSLLPQLESRLPKLNNFRKIALLQSIAERKKNTGVLPVRVRNGKLFITERSDKDHSHLNLIYQMIYDSLVSSLSKKATTVTFPKGINLTLPTSEKAFIGNIPFGSWVDTDVDTIVGINWREEDGLRDLDLSASLLNGERIGWNSKFYTGDKTMVYSGDMTSANPEATELFYCQNGAMDSVIKTNLYSGENGSEYNFFIAKVPGYRAQRSRHTEMINPNDIVYTTKLKMDQSEMTNGIFVDGKFIFTNLASGRARVSQNNPLMIKYMEHMKATSDCYLDAHKVLLDAGFVSVSGVHTGELDLSNFDKSSLIELLG